MRPKERGELAEVRRALETFPGRYACGAKNPLVFYKVWEHLRNTPQGKEAQQPLTADDEEDLRDLASLIPVEWQESPISDAGPEVPRHGMRQRMAAALSVFF